jgi:exopolyphosphatase/pppGpp-phosphohydrolase
MDDTDRSRLTGLERGREGTIHFGAIILERALNALNADGCYVSVRGWRYGMLTRLARTAM